MNTWLQNLKAGDSVFINKWQCRSVAVIEEANAVSVYVGGLWFYRATGERGTGVVLEQGTPKALEEVRDSMERNSLWNHIDDAMRDGDLTTDQLRRIAAVVDEGKGE